LGWQNAVTAMGILFGSVLLHEFGHCFGARWVGGEADEIMMWPLGGLAFTRPPHRPWPSFFTTAMGPAVTAAICFVTAVALALLNHSTTAIPWFPFKNGFRSYIPHDNTTYYLFWIFLVNYALFMFNMLLVFYPFDGGRMIQELLWIKFGYYRSMMFATVVGMIGASIVGVLGLATIGSGNGLMLMLIAGFGFYECYRQRMMLRETGPEEWQDGTDYSAAYEQPTVPKRRRHVNKRAIKRARKIAQLEIAERQHIDAILAKVSAHGMGSLTWRERRALHKATEHQRKRDLELSRET